MLLTDSVLLVSTVLLHFCNGDNAINPANCNAEPALMYSYSTDKRGNGKAKGIKVVTRQADGSKFEFKMWVQYKQVKEAEALLRNLLFGKTPIRLCENNARTARTVCSASTGIRIANNHVSNVAKKDQLLCFRPEDVGLTEETTVKSKPMSSTAKTTIEPSEPISKQTASDQATTTRSAADGSSTAEPGIDGSTVVPTEETDTIVPTALPGQQNNVSLLREIGLSILIGLGVILLLLCFCCLFHNSSKSHAAKKSKDRTEHSEHETESSTNEENLK